ncbi:Hypothetical protein NTJ_14338 [Nesidiocoris tenuis]|uniref:Uncharacterized protein n=1 Tax=Nesidiocoris tenuis TaxID=355587 RepID=A0ABN7BEG0_9HEMI|nr:Hypothetical protein NTJ_14338 [Nesidiocoris tenuis]
MPSKPAIRFSPHFPAATADRSGRFIISIEETDSLFIPRIGGGHPRRPTPRTAGIRPLGPPSIRRAAPSTPPAENSAVPELR